METVKNKTIDDSSKSSDMDTSIQTPNSQNIDGLPKSDTDNPSVENIEGVQTCF